MSAEDIIMLLDSITEYITYLYPGYVTIYVYLFLRGKTIKDSTGIIIKSIAISYLYIAMWEYGTFMSDIAYHGSLIMFSILVAYLAYWIQSLEEIVNLLEFFGIRTRFEEEPLEMLDDGETSAWVRIYLKDTRIVYEGFLGAREQEHEKRAFVILKRFKRYVIDDNIKKVEQSEEIHESDYDQVLLYFEDIVRIERIKRE